MKPINFYGFEKAWQRDYQFFAAPRQDGGRNEQSNHRYPFPSL
jgi:hypothetical protein